MKRYTRSTWRNEAQAIVAVFLDAPWAMGDWYLAADALELRDVRTQIINADPRFEGTELAHYAYVAERFPPDRRRALPWSYHEAVARFPEKEQEMFLDLVTSERWSLTELTRAAREAAKDYQ